MKVLFLTNEFPPHVYGGAGVHVEYLTRELSKLLPVEVRCFGDQQCNLHALVAKGYGARPHISRDAFPALQSTLNTIQRGVDFNIDPIQADIVHCHTWYAHWGGILTKLLYGLPLVITTHSLEPLRPWKREQLGRGYDFSSWVERTALTMADSIIAVSEETRKDILRLFSVDPNKVTVIPNGLDPEEYRKTDRREALQTYGIPDSLRYVLFVGRITRQKGIMHLVRAIRHLDSDVGVVLCAGEPDTKEIGAEMEQGVAEVQKQRGNVYWIREMVSRQAAIQLYSHASVFCCPSIYEPFGIINLEAMACGAPVVATAVGGIKEVVVHEQTGILVPFEQQPEPPFEAKNFEALARDLATAIMRLIRDEALRSSMAVQGRKRVEDRYSWKAVAESVFSLYRSLTETGAS